MKKKMQKDEYRYDVEEKTKGSTTLNDDRTHSVPD